MSSHFYQVVLAVAELFYYLAPYAEMAITIRPLVHLISKPREIQYVVLTAIVSMVSKRTSLFEPYMKLFFVKESDPMYIRLLKLEAITAVVNESNVGFVLREFQAYLRSPVKDFVIHTVQVSL